MKKLLKTLILCFPLVGVAQDFSRWQIGLNFNPYNFSRQNEVFSAYKDKTNLINGIGFGITLEKQFGILGLKTGIEYTFENSNHTLTFQLPVNDTKIKSSFNFIKMPLLCQYYIGINENLTISLSQGIQLLYLNNYKTIMDNGDFNYWVYENNTVTYTSVYNGQLPIIYSDASIHKKFNIGLKGAAGIKYFVTDNISISNNLMYEYDLSNSDDWPSYPFISSNNKTNDIRHLRLGLELGIQYHYDKFIKFNKNPK